MTTAVLTQIRTSNLWGQIKNHAVLILATGVLLLLILVPLVRLILSSFQFGHPAMPEGWSSFQFGHPAMPEGWTLQNYISAYSLPVFYRALATTIVLSAIGTSITMTIAILFAWLIERTDMPFRNLAWSLILIPMAIPGVLFALGWALLLAPKTGSMNLVLRSGLELFGVHLTQGPLNIYSVGGLIFLDGLRGVTTIFLMVVGSFRMMDPSLEEAARVSKAGPIGTFFQVTLPVLLPAVLTAGMYEFVSSMESFEAPLAVGLPAGIFVLSTLIYFTVRLQAPVDYGLGAVYGVTYMIMLRRHLHDHVAFPSLGLSPRRALHRALQHDHGEGISSSGYRSRQVALPRAGHVSDLLLINRCGSLRDPSLGLFAAELSHAFL